MFCTICVFCINMSINSIIVNFANSLKERSQNQRSMKHYSCIYIDFIPSGVTMLFVKTFALRS